MHPHLRGIHGHVPSHRNQFLVRCVSAILSFKREFSPLGLFRSSRRICRNIRFGSCLLNLLSCPEGYGLSWALGIFISPLMAKLKNFRIIPCVGAILMSSGLILASFSTTVLATKSCFDANSSSHSCISERNFFTESVLQLFISLSSH